MTSRDGSRNNSLIAGVLAFALTIYPPIQAYILGGTSAIATFFAADAFYYLSIAANSSFGKYTFDGTALTNGFHPLWQILLQLVVGHLEAKHGLGPVLASFSLSILVTALGLAFVGAGVARLSHRWWPVLLLFPGAYYWFASTIDPRFGSVWSFVNGMESPLSILFFGLFFLLLVRREEIRNVRYLLLLSGVSLCIVLSRLDDIFLVFVFAVWLGLSSRKLIGLPGAVRLTVIYLSPIFVGLTLYLLFNLRTVGVLLPTSGSVKSDHLGFLKNLIWLFVVAVPFSASLLRHFSSQIPAQIQGIVLGWRLSQMLVPMAIAAFLIGFRKPVQWIGRGDAAKLRMLLSYVLVKGGYNLLFVPLIRQGHWYYVVSIIILDIVAALGIARVLEQYGPTGSTMTWAIICPIACLALISSSATVWRVLDPSWKNTTNTEVLARGSLIRAAVQSVDPGGRIIEFDDGILNYAMSTPTLSGFGLAADATTARAIGSGTLLSYAASQGFDLIGTANYDPIEMGEQVSSEKLREVMLQWIFFRHERDLDQFDFSIAYQDPVSHAEFIRFVRRP